MVRTCHSANKIRCEWDSWWIWNQHAHLAGLTESFSTQDELVKFPVRTGHIGHQKLYNYLRRIRPNHLDEHTRKQLQEIQQERRPRSKYNGPPRVFSVRVRHEGILFNSESIVDAFYVGSQYAVFVFNRDTEFLSARMLKT